MASGIMLCFSCTKFRGGFRYSERGTTPPFGSGDIVFCNSYVNKNDSSIESPDNQGCGCTFGLLLGFAGAFLLLGSDVLDRGGSVAAKIFGVISIVIGFFLIIKNRN